MKKISKPASKKRRSILTAVAILLIFGITLPFAISGIMCASVQDRIVTLDEASSLDVDCILVLGARVWDNGNPSGILEDRLITGISAYHGGSSDRILMQTLRMD